MQVPNDIIEKFMSAYAAPAIQLPEDDDFDDPTISDQERAKRKEKREKINKLLKERDDALAREAEEERKRQRERDMWIMSEWEKLEQERISVTQLLHEREVAKQVVLIPNQNDSIIIQTSNSHVFLQRDENQNEIYTYGSLSNSPSTSPRTQSPRSANSAENSTSSDTKRSPRSYKPMNKAATIANLGSFVVGNKQQQEIDQTRMMKQVPKPLTTLLNEAILFGLQGIPNIDILKKHLHREGRLEISTARRIITLVQDLFRVEPNVLELLAPITVIGDIHGQYYDLETLIEKGGDPSVTRYLFLGDYVDRGMFSTECCFYLFTLKLCYPNNIFMLRGNHESRVLTEHFNFKTECLFKYNLDIYELFMDCFDCLPLSALVVNHQGTFFCAHGGIGPELESVQQIREMDRFIEIPEEGNYCDLIWSDPIELDEDLDEYEIIQWSRVEFQFNSARGCGWCYGYASVDRFLDENNLLCIVRAHEVQRDGYFEHTFGIEERAEPAVITVFSAPNYCDVYENSAALMTIDMDDYDFQTIEAVSHPFYLPNFVDAITFSLPFVAENLMKIFAYVLSIPDEEVMDEIDHSLQKKITYLSKLSVLLKKARIETEDWLNPSKHFAQGQDTFSQAMSWDRSHEKRPRGSNQRKLQKHRSCRF